MLILHNISRDKHNSNYNTPQEVEQSEGPLSFDGVYYNVYLNQGLLEGRDVTLFVMGDYVGKTNKFDIGQPLERYCDWNQIMELVEIYNCRLGWHSWSHRDLTTLSEQEILKEVIPPIPMDVFAYPYGKFNDKVIEAVKIAGFKEAYSVTEGDGSEYQRLRAYL